MASVELTARGSGYYRVIVNGAQFSQHTTEREAIESVTEVLYGAPDATVYYDHDYHVDAELSLDSAEVPPVTDPDVLPTSDGGMDLVEFLQMLDEQASGPVITGTVLEAPDMYSGLEHLTRQHRDEGSWLFQRLSVLMAGPDEPATQVGLSWRGYMLLWHLRDKAAIRINAG